MRWLHFIFTHSVFVSFCAVALCLQTYLLLHIPIIPLICVLVFFCTLCSYNFYWLLSKFHFSGSERLPVFFRRNPGNIMVGGIAAIGIVFCLFFLPQVIPVLIVALVLTLLYSLPLWPGKLIRRLTRAGFMKTVLLSLTWTYVTIMIPVFDSLVFNEDLILLAIARFSFMLMLCSIFDSRDVSLDKIRGLRSLATDVTAGALRTLMIIFFAIYMLSGYLLRYYYNDISQMISFTVTGIAVFYIYSIPASKRNYFYYYFLVDGLMLFSATSTFLATIF